MCVCMNIHYCDMCMYGTYTCTCTCTCIHICNYYCCSASFVTEWGIDALYMLLSCRDLSIRSKTRPRAQKSCGDEVQTPVQIIHDSTVTSIIIIAQPPCPPPPFLLHLGITANTHSLSDYADTFGDLDTFYISPPHQCSPQVEGDSLCMKTEERDLLLSVLGQITRYMYVHVVYIHVHVTLKTHTHVYQWDVHNTHRLRMDRTPSRPVKCVYMALWIRYIPSVCVCFPLQGATK